MIKTSTSNAGVHRYAQAFFHAIRGERLEPIMAEYRMVLELLKAYPDLVTVLNHLLLNDEQKEDILSRVIQTCSVSKEMASFLRTLVRRRHVDWMETIYHYMQAMVDEEHNKATAQIKSAVKLSESQQEKLRKRLEELTSKKIELKVEQDPSILGGIVVQVGDRIFDSSLHNKLHLIKESMSKNG